jgi:hypothetical protein
MSLSLFLVPKLRLGTRKKRLKPAMITDDSLDNLSLKARG